MSKLLVGTTELNVLSCYAHEHVNGKRELRVTLLQTEKSYEELKALFKNEDGADIIHTKDDGTVHSYIGYKFTVDITGTTNKEHGEVFNVVVKCVAEAERKALEANAKADGLTVIVGEQNSAIAALAEENAASIEVEAELLYELSLMQLGLI